MAMILSFYTAAVIGLEQGIYYLIAYGYQYFGFAGVAVSLLIVASFITTIYKSVEEWFEQ